MRADRIMDWIFVDPNDTLHYLSQAYGNKETLVKLGRDARMLQPFFGGENAGA